MFGIDISIIFFLKTLLLGIASVLAIPRQVYKKFLLYGFVFGGVGEIISVIILEPVLHLIQYTNMGRFSMLGIISFWTPIAWMFAFMLFFYYLPARKVFLYLYIAFFSIYAYFVGLFLQNFGLFDYVGDYKYFAPFVFVLWFSVSARFYLLNEKVNINKIT